MKTFNQFANIYCVLLYAIALTIFINEAIAYHYNNVFFEGFRIAVPVLIFIFFHFPPLLFFLLTKNKVKWGTLLTFIPILYLCIMVDFSISTILLPLIVLVGLTIHFKQLFTIIMKQTA